MADSTVQIKLAVDTPVIAAHMRSLVLESLRELASKAYVVQNKPAGGCACPGSSQKQCGYAVGSGRVIDLIHDAILALEKGAVPSGGDAA